MSQKGLLVRNKSIVLSFVLISKLDMSKVCQITGKKVMVGNNVSHALNRTKRTFEPNLFDKKFFIPSSNDWVKLRVSKAGLREIDKKGIEVALKEAKAAGFLK
tara:strand:+ start:1350 stop:1658 length:309 start_codon:yes stop_codon:yes gene_type:complete